MKKRMLAVFLSVCMLGSMTMSSALAAGLETSGKATEESVLTESVDAQGEDDSEDQDEDSLMAGSLDTPLLYSDTCEEGEEETQGNVLLASGESSADSAVMYSKSVSVTDSGVIQITLENGELDYTSAGTVTMQITNEERNGIYFLSGTSLGFYSLSDYSYQIVYTFVGCTSAYEEGDKLYVLSGTTCYVYDLNENQLEREITFSNLSSEETVTAATAIGADPSGRLYVATRGTADSESIYQIWLYSADGTLLSSASSDARIYCFSGFDADSGNFFMESYYNWVYWGYDHDGRAVTMGNVTDNTISFTETSGSVTVSGILTYSLSCLEYLCQSYYYQHQTGAAVIGGRYLVTASTTFGRVYVAETDSLEVVLSISRSAIEEEQDDDYYDLNSIGVRTVYNDANDSIIVYENEKTLNEYDPETGEMIGTYETEHYVFNLLTMGENVIAIEKEDGQYYMEIIAWSSPTEFAISAEKETMKVGESQQLSVSSLAGYASSYEWSSSDSTVATVTSSGKVSAWKEGTAVISYTSPDGNYSASCTITVSGTTVTTPSAIALTLSGTVTDNRSDNNYSTYCASNVKSYLYENEDGTLTRVEYISGTGICVEVINPDTGKTVSSRTLSMELSLWGGFYSGEDYNFIVVGQTNYDEDDSKEVVRVIRYTKDWVRVDACSIYGANTYVPFNAGSLRMTELDGTLYIYTCHTMYDTGDGYHHQANMTFVLDEDTMSVTDSYYDIMNIAQAGYVSHSFNQYIQTDGEYIYRVDHGDAYPRAVSITKCAVGADITSVSYTYALQIQGTTGANATGVSVGGFELSDDNCLIVGNSVDQSDSDSYSASGQRNIFLTVTDKTYLETTTIWLTDYTSSDGITPRTPQLVKLSEDQFLILWEEYDSDTGDVQTRMVTVNGEGTKTGEVTSDSIRLSDCQPIVTSDGIVTWYVTDGSSSVLYQVNPYDLSAYQILANGLADSSVNGVWYYYTNGSVDTGFTGLAENKNGWFYVKNGQVDFTYSGLYKYNGSWVYIKSGALKSSYTGLAYNPGTYGTAGWWYLEDGAVKFSYTGIATNTSGTFAVRSGKVDFSYTGLIKSNNAWYYAKSGVIQTSYTGLVYNSGTYGTAGWWYVSFGRVSFVTGIVYNPGTYGVEGYWYVKNGKVDFSYSGKVTYNRKTYTIKKGQVV